MHKASAVCPFFSWALYQFQLEINGVALSSASNICVSVRSSTTCVDWDAVGQTLGTICSPKPASEDWADVFTAVAFNWTAVCEVESS